jgi:CheY-like chemotaxis protein
MKPPAAAARIAIVEDERDYRELLIVWLRPRYYACGFETGRELLEAFKHEHFDLIVTDINMPEMSGIDLIEIVRSNVSRTIPALGLTANFEATSRETAIAAGFTEYLSKLASLSEIESQIAAILARGKRHLRRAALKNTTS